MKSKHREINIINMSLLDILTGALGAFLFLMLGMIPYYIACPDLKPMGTSMASQEEVDNLKKRVKELEEQVKKLEEANEELRDQLRRAGKGDITAEELSKLQDEIAKLRKENEELKAKLFAAQQEIDKLKAENEDLKDEIDELQDKLARLDNYITQLKQDLEKANQRIAQLEQEKEELLKRIKELEQQPQAEEPPMTALIEWNQYVDLDFWVRIPYGDWSGPKDLPWGEPPKYRTFDGNPSPMSDTKYEFVTAYFKSSGEYWFVYFVPEGTDVSSLYLTGYILSYEKKDLVQIYTIPNIKVEEAGKMKIFGVSFNGKESVLRWRNNLQPSEREAREDYIQSMIAAPPDQRARLKAESVKHFDELTSQNAQDPGAAHVAHFENELERLEKLLEKSPNNPDLERQVYKARQRVNEARSMTAPGRATKERAAASASATPSTFP